MGDFSYASAEFVVRDDLREAHRSAWQALASPGTWWTGAERIAIADETRRAFSCSLCRRRKKALSPNAVEGKHDSGGDLPPHVVDAVHRVSTDASRLSREWVQGLIEAGLSYGHYVELIGVAVTTISIDSFHRGIGIASEALPEPENGAPSRYRPPAVRGGEAWVPMIPSGRAGEAEADLYREAPGGRTGNVVRALSLVPDEVRMLKQLSAAQYLASDRMMDLSAGRTLNRRQIELVAGRVSSLNECFY